MAPVVRDTLSLRPQGFYGYAFLMARLAQIVILSVITGLTGHLTASTSRDRQGPPGTLAAILFFTSAALLWTLFSWTGYSRRYLPYSATLSADVVFLIPFVVITIVLGLPLADADCAATDRKFEVAVPSPSSQGKIVFPNNGKAACFKLLTVWGLLIAVCALFVISALSVAFLLLGERQLRKAVFAVREEPSRGEAGLFGQRLSEPSDRGFAPTTMSQPGFVRAEAGMGRLGMNEVNDSPTPPRPSITDDRLDLNRPVTIAPPRGRNRPAEGGPLYDEPLGQPAAARVPRLRPEDGFQQPAYRRVA